MICEKIKQGKKICAVKNRYYQRAVIVNRSDLSQYNIIAEGNYHNVSFTLKSGLTGYTFASSETGANIVGTVAMSRTNNLPEYTHTVSIYISNNQVLDKVILRQLDLSDVFVALLDYENKVEIFGFDFGLQTDDWEFNLHDNGVVLNLFSDIEYELPYIYVNDDGSEVSDFDNEFRTNKLMKASAYSDGYSDGYTN